MNFNGLRLLKEGLHECLNFVLKTEYPNFEVIFVDNGSADESVNYVKSKFNDSRLKIIENKHNLGFAGGNNVGIKISGGDYIALLNSDTVVSPNWLKEVIKVMESKSQIGVAGCKLLLYGKKDLIDYVGGKLSINGGGILIGHGEQDRGQYDHIKDDFDYVGGASIIIKRALFQRVGLLDPGYFLFYEETDFCCRARKAGFKIVYIPKAAILHRHSATFKKVDPTGLYKFYMLNRSRIRFILIHFNVLKLLRAIAFDYFQLFLIASNHRLLLLKAYLWNIKNMATILKRKLRNL